MAQLTACSSCGEGAEAHVSRVWSSDREPDPHGVRTRCSGSRRRQESAASVDGGLVLPGGWHVGAPGFTLRRIGNAMGAGGEGGRLGSACGHAFTPIN